MILADCAEGAALPSILHNRPAQIGSRPLQQGDIRHSVRSLQRKKRDRDAERLINGGRRRG